uniref:Uncharacterized protein n=1 Tax=Ditylenchus dipsaci TaxID=166011 RepID=A0A915EWH3_9BILA
MLKNADIYKHPRPSRTETLQFIANNMSQLEHLENTSHQRFQQILDCRGCLRLKESIVKEGQRQGQTDLRSRLVDKQTNLIAASKTNSLRNLEFATEMGLTAENVMQYLRVFTHLETFYCKIRYLNTTHHFFCKESADVLLKIDSNENFEGKARLKRVFRFQLEYYLGHIDNGI